MIVLIITLISFNTCTADKKFCQDLKPTHDFDEDAILGLWYIHEFVLHNENLTQTVTDPYCPTFQIRKLEDYVASGLINRNLPTPPAPYPPLANSYVNDAYGYGLPEQHRIRYFVLEWHQGLWQNDYHFKVNTSHKGFWQTDVPSTAVESMYRHFGGVIQVLKAANNYLVLNFCTRVPEAQFYSVVLSRNENQLTPEDLSSIHSIFTSKHLSTSALKRVCYNSGVALKYSSLIFVLACILVWRTNA